MKLDKFINSISGDNNPIGDFAKDAKNDSKFKQLQSDKEKLAYLKRTSYYKGTDTVFQDFLKAYSVETPINTALYQ